MNEPVPDARLVDMVKPDGSVVGLPSYNVEKAVARGYRIESPDERQQRLVQKAFGDRTAEATIAGALRGATFGLSDVLATKLGIVEPTTLSGLEQASPVASVVGEIGGAVGSALITKKAPTAIVSRLTAAIAPRVATRLGGGLLARGAGVAAAQGAEGVVYGLGQLVTDEALGHADYTAENLLTYAGLGAATGAGMGAVFGVGGELAKKAAHGITHATAGAVDRLYQATTGQATDGKLGEAWRLATKGLSKAHGLVGEGDPAAIRAGLESAAVRANQIPFSDEEVYDLATRLTRAENAIHQATEKAMPEAVGLPKREMVAQRVRTGNEGAVVAANKKALDDIRSMLLYARAHPTIYKESGEAIDDMVARIDDYYGTVVGLRRVPAKPEQVVETVSPVLDAQGRQVKTVEVIPAEPEGWEKIPKWKADNTTAYMEMDQLKRLLGQPQFSQAGRFWPSGVKGPAAERFRTSYDEVLQPHLENLDLWGEAAQAQRETNKGWVKALFLEPDFQRAFMSKATEESRVVGRKWSPAYDADITKNINFLRSVGTGKGNSAYNRQVLQNHLKYKMDLADAIVDNYDNVSPETIQAVLAARKELAGLDDVFKTIDTRVVGSNQIRAMASGDSVTATALGYALGGGPGALAAQLIARPDRIIRTLAALDRMAAQVRGRVTSGVDAFINRGAGAARAAAERLRPAAGVVSGKAGRREDFEEKALCITNDAADPEGLARRTTGALSSLHYDAPRVAQAMVIKDMQRRAYLFKELPKATRPPSLFDKPGTRPGITDFAMDAWLDKFEIAFDPARTIDHLVAGTLSPAHVDALRNTALETFKSMQSEIAARVPGSGLPYQDRLRLGMLFGLQLDPTTDPTFVAAMKPAPPPKQTHESKGIRADQQPLEERTASASTALAEA